VDDNAYGGVAVALYDRKIPPVLMKLPILSLALIVFLAFGTGRTFAQISVENYGSIQEAIDKNPGKMIEVPPGDYPITASLQISADNSGLYGFGRIIQSDPKAAILTVGTATNIQIRDLTFTRAEGAMVSTNHGVLVKNCSNVVLDNLQVLENQSRFAGIEVDGGRDIRVLNCRVEDYMRISVDDRTRSTDWGFAFNVIDGTGINVRDATGVLIQGNSVVEKNFVPTPELKQKYHLGEFCKMNAQKGVLTHQEMWDNKYYNAWHQGAAIAVPTPETEDYVQIIGNYIENAAQGLDIHADHVIVSQNIINNAFIGMKAMHGSRNVSIVGNQFSRNDLWAIGLMPGAASHEAGVAAHANVDPATAEANIDGGSIVANNIISDFGFGTAYWMWKDWKDMVRAPMRFDPGQKDFNPPLRDVLVDGNVIYDTGRDKIMENGKPVLEPPRYTYSVFVSTAPRGPQDMHFANNLFNPGTSGTSNIQLAP
jgi:hypothetical protein